MKKTKGISAARFSEIRKEVEQELAMCGVRVVRYNGTVKVYNKHADYGTITVYNKHSDYDVWNEPIPPIVKLWDEAVMRMTHERAYFEEVNA